ncbi:MAG: UDP-N-acetylmuramoyl-tripeptide--D-alanyl-D-alanine ligase [Patescibacteria group bacterium]
MSLQTRFQSFLGRSAQKTLAREKPLIIAVTGCVGKSTTKELLAAVLHAEDPLAKVRASKKNYNNELGLPLTVFNAEAPGRSPFAWMSLLWRAWTTSMGIRKTGVQTFIFEMGADKPGDLAYLTSIAEPDISIVTAVTPEDTSWAPVHAANYPSIEALAQEKETLVRATKADGMAILNADDRRVFAMRSAAQCRVATFGQFNEGADVRILSTRMVMAEGKRGNEPKGLEVTLEYFHHRITLLFKGVFGTPVAYSAAAAVAVAVTLDAGEDAIASMPAHFLPLQGRTRILPGIKYTTLLDDTYNASPVAVLSSIRDLASMPLQEHQRRIVCLGEMRELGEQAEMLHERVGAEAAKQGIDLLVACGIFAHAIAEGARANGMSEDQIKIFEDTPEAGVFIQDWMKPGDIVLAKASQGPEPGRPGWNQVTGVRMERVIKELMADPGHAEQVLCRQSEEWLA